MAKETLSWPGLEPKTSGLRYQLSPHLSYPALWMVVVPNSQLVFAEYYFRKIAFRNFIRHRVCQLYTMQLHFHRLKATVQSGLPVRVGYQVARFKINGYSYGCDCFWACYSEKPIDSMYSKNKVTAIATHSNITGTLQQDSSACVFDEYKLPVVEHHNITLNLL